MTYSPEMVMLIQQLRSRIRAEFGVKIRLVDPELLSTLGEMGKKSRDQYTRKTVAELLSMAGSDFSLESKAEPQKKKEKDHAAITEMTYRGQKVYRDANATREPVAQSESLTLDPAEEGAAPKKTKQMYRGQVVYK
ncbi:hypothetical protein IB286_02165 [Spongiibacter sp. KMU-158]|uniref:Uncharacterized protein n=1 Tax=Spongiibacter pelagi TaxID=2760804 RepID=A0A927GUX6_9GAMM|nr:hypothetical protein [Spongiibacter pelagi]MBD2857795.1 hypothetical protein [Spongiibacter pelagi]